MKKYFSALLLSFVATTTFSQTTNDEVITTLNTLNDGLNGLNSMSFCPIGSNIFSIDYNNGIIRKYNKEWNLLETHDAKQETYKKVLYQAAERSYVVDNATGHYILSDWEDSEPTYNYLDCKRYAYTVTNFADLYKGNDQTVYYLRSTVKDFIKSHRVYLVPDYCGEISGMACSTANAYSTLITDIDFIDWDGNVIQKIILPYYAANINSQFINVEDKSYIIIGADRIYNKNIPVDIDLHSEEEYNIENNAVEPESFHYFVYEYDKNSSSVQFIQSFTSSKEDKKEIGIYDINGIKLQQPQKGVNLIIYSDGSSKKVIVK